MKIKAIAVKHYPICGDKGSIQVFFNKNGKLKYGRAMHIMHKDQQGYNPNNKYNFRYCKIEDLQQLETLLISLNFQFSTAKPQAKTLGQDGQGTSNKIHDRSSVSLIQA